MGNGVSPNKILTISVCIPTYNRAELIADAIRSVLIQGCTPKELIICDNASTDGTEDVVAKFNSAIILYYRNKRNIGMCRNFNKCLEVASGDIVTLLHSDDWYVDDTVLERVGHIFQENPDAAIVYSASAQMDERCKKASDESSNYELYKCGIEAAQHVYRRGQLPCSSTFYCHSFALACGGFDQKFSTCCDEEFNSRMSLKGDVIYSKIPFAAYRRHPGHLMYDSWLRFDFLQQYFDSRMQMGLNAGLSEAVIRTEITERISETLLTSSHMAFRHRRVDAARKLHQSILKLAPQKYRRIKNLKMLLLHYFPCSYYPYMLARSFYRKIKTVLYS